MGAARNEENLKLLWCDPCLLSNYLSWPKGPGLYVIGRARDPSIPVTVSNEYDGYALNWPDNFEGLYVGNSLSCREGVRARLRSHFRCRGNKLIATHIKAGECLYFIAIAGLEAAE